MASDQTEPTGPPAQPTPAPADPLEQIGKLAELHGKGAITDEDYERAKQDLLDRL